MKQCAKCKIADQCERVWKDPEEPYMNCVSWTPIITNADKIRAMTDEELDEWLSYICDAYYMPSNSQGWLGWLREEVKEA